MEVRVMVRWEGEDKKSAALLNAGYESATPEVIIPVGVARRLGLWPKVPEGTEVAGGGLVRTYFIEDCLEVEVIDMDRVSEEEK